MLIRLNEISPVGSHFEFHTVDGLDALPDIVVLGPVKAQCTLQRKGESKAELQGRLAATLELECDRCLSQYALEVDTVLHILFEVETDTSWQVKDLEYRIPDLDTVVLEEPVIDLDDTIRQQLLLAVPMKKLCSEQCKGICLRCGANLNQNPCDCDSDPQDSPFAILAQLKKQH